MAQASDSKANLFLFTDQSNKSKHVKLIGYKKHPVIIIFLTIQAQNIIITKYVVRLKILIFLYLLKINKIGIIAESIKKGFIKNTKIERRLINLK